MCVGTCTFVWGGRGQSGVVLNLSTLFFELRSVTGLDAPIQLKWLARELQIVLAFTLVLSIEVRPSCLLCVASIVAAESPPWF